MDTTYRFRFLIYFAAFMLVMSLCFVYAEPVPPARTSLLLAASPQHVSFLSTLNAEPSFDPAALRVAATPAISPAMLEQLEQSLHPHHALFHRSHRRELRSAPLAAGAEATVLNNGAWRPLASAETTHTR